jgi:PAS domain S-box-containing protein
LRTGFAVPLTVFLGGLCLAAGAGLWQRNEIRKDAERDFLHVVERVSADISRRFRQPIYGLKGAKGVYAVSEHVTRAKFRAYVESRNLSAEFRGVRGFGMIQRVMRPNLDAFVAVERADGAPRFDIRQLADRDHEDLYVIKIIEPAASNTGAQGLDIGSEAVRRAAAEQAVESGEPTITGAITLVQDQRKTPGVLLFVPLYAKGSAPTNAQERRETLVGLLYAPIVINELLERMPDVGGVRGVDVDIFDAPGGSADGTLLFDVDRHATQQISTHAARNPSLFSIRQSLSLPGRELTLKANSTPEFDAAIDVTIPWLMFVGIALISALIALVLRQQATGRVRAEVLAEHMTEKLREDQERASDFSKSASDWFWESDAQHRFCYFSDNFEQVYGLPPSQLLGKSRKELLELNALNPAGTTVEHFAQLEAHLPFKSFEYRIRISDDDLRWIMVSGVPRFDTQGRFSGYRGTGTLITERKSNQAAAEELKRQVDQLNQRFSIAADAAHIGVWDYLVPENRLIWDKWMYALYGVREADFSGAYEAWQNGLHPDDRARGDERIGQALRGEKEFDVEFRVVWPTGEVRHLKAAALVLRDPDGKPLRMIGVNYDITERKNKEEELRQAELLLRSAIETIGEAFVVYDPDDRLAFFNDEYRELYFQSAPVIEVGRHFEEIVRYGVERGHYKDAIGREEEWLAERLKAHRQGDQELIQRLEDGRWLKITERHTPSGHIVGFRVDVTEFYRAKEAAEAANIAKSRFLATMSHEIRTPMNGILGMAQMLLMPNLDDTERKDYARTILTSGESLLSLLNDILDLSKVEAGRFELESAALQPGQIIHGIQTLFAETAGKKGLRLESEWTGPAGQRYLGDPHRLRQMLSNLVGNAIKFTAQGQIRIEASEVERDEQGALLEFIVEDTGIGIPEEKQALLFKPFSQTDSSITRQYGGTGLGLSIVRSLAKLMGGDAGIESEAGKGSRFWFRIRVGLVATGTDSRDDIRDAAEVPGSGQGTGVLKGRILAVDDNPTNRKVIKAMLNRPGLHCDLVEDGQQAVDAITGGMAPDLILMDCQMPVMDGFEASRRIRHWESEHGGKRVAIIALTASVFEADRDHCLEAGMDDFLGKPINLDKLTAMLERWLPSSNHSAVEEAAVQPVETQGLEDVLPVFDEETLLSQLAGDRDLAKTIVLSATEDIPGYFDELDQAIVAGHWKDAERKTHTLKGLAAQIGGMKLSRRMQDIDEHLKGGGEIDLATAADLRRDYEMLADTLQKWMR